MQISCCKLDQLYSNIVRDNRAHVFLPGYAIRFGKLRLARELMLEVKFPDDHKELLHASASLHQTHFNSAKSTASCDRYVLPTYQSANPQDQWRQSLHCDTRQASRKAEPSHHSPSLTHLIPLPSHQLYLLPLHHLNHSKFLSHIVKAMAEILGTVTSGFAVVSLAIQVAETIHKLKTFHSLMQSAPADILFAIEELETLSMVLEDVDRSMQEQLFLDPRVKGAVMKSWRLCKVTVDGLVSLVGSLEEGLGKGKRKMSGSLRVAMKKGEMDE